MAMPRLHASCLPWLHDRKIAVLGSDAVSDVEPTNYDAHSRCRFMRGRSW
jgi:hypothetical protein